MHGLQQLSRASRVAEEASLSPNDPLQHFYSASMGKSIVILQPGEKIFYDKKGVALAVLLHASHIAEENAARSIDRNVGTEDRKGDEVKRSRVDIGDGPSVAPIEVVNP